MVQCFRSKTLESRALLLVVNSGINHAGEILDGWMFSARMRREIGHDEVVKSM